jgi:hypothetical protein
MEGLKLKSVVASLPIKLSPHQRPMTDPRHPGWACPARGPRCTSKACKGLFPYTSCIPILLQVSCVSTLSWFLESFFCQFFSIRRSFSHCWLRYSFHLPFATVLAYRCITFLTFPRPGAFTSLPQSFHQTLHHLHDLTTPHTATLRLAAQNNS